ncbi:hypothetical protein ABPG77_008893 [Micractinium sp. CCAP 211/92]
MSSIAVTQYEVCVLVLGWLEDAKFGRTAAALKREAKAQFRAAGGTASPPGVRNLLDLLNDYVKLKEAEAARAALAAINPLAARVLAALDEETALVAQQGQRNQGPAAQTAAAATQQRRQLEGQGAVQVEGVPQPPSSAALYGQQHQQQHAAACAGCPTAGGGRALGFARQQGVPTAQPQQQAAAAVAAAGALPGQPQAATPGRHRKGAPRKRQRGAELPPAAGGATFRPEAPAFPAVALFGGGGGDGTGWGSPVDLLSLPLDASGLELLLDDGPMQLAFAEHLAQCINTTGVMDPNDVLAELPADPVLAGVLQQVVRPGTASPGPPSPEAAAPGARAPSRGAGCSRRLPQPDRRSHQAVRAQRAEALDRPGLASVGLEAPRLRQQEQQLQQEHCWQGQQPGKQQQQQAPPPVGDQEDEGMPDALSPAAEHAGQKAGRASPRVEAGGAAGGPPELLGQAAASVSAAMVGAESGAQAALAGRQPPSSAERASREEPATARLDTGRPCPAASHAAVLPARKPAPQTIEAVAAVVNAKLAELGPLEPATVDQLLDDIEDMF